MSQGDTGIRMTCHGNVQNIVLRELVANNNSLQEKQALDTFMKEFENVEQDPASFLRYNRLSKRENSCSEESAVTASTSVTLKNRNVVNDILTREDSQKVAYSGNYQIISNPMSRLLSNNYKITDNSFNHSVPQRNCFLRMLDNLKIGKKNKIARYIRDIEKNKNVKIKEERFEQWLNLLVQKKCLMRQPQLKDFIERITEELNSLKAVDDPEKKALLLLKEELQSLRNKAVLLQEKMPWTLAENLKNIM